MLLRSFSFASACAVFGVLAACDRGGTADPERPSTTAIRIASFSPAMSATLVDLGCESNIVARSPWCTDVAKSLPVVGDFRDFDAERILLVSPSHIVLQPPLSGINPALESFAKAQGIALVAVQLDRMRDVRQFVSSVAPLASDAARVRARLDAIDAIPLVDVHAPRVVVLVSAEPMLAAGGANYLTDLLPIVHLRNALDAEGWIECSHEALAARDPDLLLGIAEREESVAGLRRALEAIPCRASRSGRIVVVVSPELLRPSTRSIDAMRALQSAIDAVLRTASEQAP